MMMSGFTYHMTHSTYVIMVRRWGGYRLNIIYAHVCMYVCVFVGASVCVLWCLCFCVCVCWCCGVCASVHVCVLVLCLL